MWVKAVGSKLWQIGSWFFSDVHFNRKRWVRWVDECDWYFHPAFGVSLKRVTHKTTIHKQNTLYDSERLLLLIWQLLTTFSWRSLMNQTLKLPTVGWVTFLSRRSRASATGAHYISMRSIVVLIWCGWLIWKGGWSTIGPAVIWSASRRARVLHRLLIPRELVVGIVQKIIGYSLVCEVISFQNVDLTYLFSIRDVKILLKDNDHMMFR